MALASLERVRKPGQLLRTRAVHQQILTLLRDQELYAQGQDIFIYLKEGAMYWMNTSLFFIICP